MLVKFTSDEAGPHQCLKCNTTAQVIDSKLDDGWYIFCPKCYEHEVTHGKKCCKNYELEYVRVEIAGGRLQLRKCCKNCKALEAGAMKHSLVPDINKVPIVTDLPDRWKQKDQERTAFRQWAFEKQNNNWRQRYETHLNSDKWRQLRHLVLQRDNHICQSCLLVRASEVHHKTYDRLGNEAAFDLVSLCSSCHKQIHGNQHANL